MTNNKKMKKIKDMSDEEIKNEIQELNTPEYRKVHSRITTLRSELRARNILKQYYDKQ